MMERSDISLERRGLALLICLKGAIRSRSKFTNGCKHSRMECNRQREMGSVRCYNYLRLLFLVSISFYFFFFFFKLVEVNFLRIR